MHKEEEIKKEVEKLANELKQAIEIRNKNEEVIKEIGHKLFKLLCPKHYLDKCEPAYCLFRLTDSCEYIKILRKLNKEIKSK